MKQTHHRWRLLWVLGLALGVAGVWAGSRGWRIPARELPLPAAASAALREALAAGPVPDVAAARGSVPADAQAWVRLARERDAAAARAVQRLARRLSVRIEPTWVGGVRAYWVRPPEPAAYRGRAMMYLHGGAYVFNAGLAGQAEPVLIAARVGIPVLSVDYRMPPTHPFPAALDDALAAWRGAIEDHAPESMALGGSSAGGGLALALVHRLKALALPLPGALYLGTPWSDLSKTGDSYWINEGVDRLLVTYDGALGAAARLYAGGRDLKDVLISPVYGDFTGFPPTTLVTGTRDLFLSLTVRVHRRLREAGVEAELNVYEGLSHGDYMGLRNTPESRQVYRELDEFLRRHLSRGGGAPAAAPPAV